MICQLQIIFFFCPFSILQYKFLSYREVPHVLSQLSELIELPEVFSSMEKALLHQALRLGDLLLELRFVSRSSETSQSSISFRPAFPDEGGMGFCLSGLRAVLSIFYCGSFWSLRRPDTF